MGKFFNGKRAVAIAMAVFVLVTITFSQLLFASDNLPDRNENNFVDGENLLSDTTKEVIKSVNDDLVASDKGEIVVVTTDSFDPYSNRDEYANKLFEKWMIGSDEKDNGLLIVVSAEKKESRVEVGYGLEELLPDGKVGRFMDEHAIPFFKEDKYDQGIRNLFLEFTYEIAPELKEKYKQYQDVNESEDIDNGKDKSKESDEEGIIDKTLSYSLMLLMIGAGFAALYIIFVMPLLIIRFIVLMIMARVYASSDRKNNDIKLLKFQYSFKKDSIIYRKIGNYITNDEERAMYYSEKLKSEKLKRGYRTFFSAFSFITGLLMSEGGSDSGGSSSGGSSGGGSSGGGGAGRSW